jgi:hypothetical protein
LRPDFIFERARKEPKTPSKIPKSSPWKINALWAALPSVAEIFLENQAIDQRAGFKDWSRLSFHDTQESPKAINL